MSASPHPADPHPADPHGPDPRPADPPIALRTRVAATAAGVLISTALAGALVIAGLKAGITPGVSPLVLLIAWGIWRDATRRPDGPARLNLIQVSGSAGMAVTAGVIFTAPLWPILQLQRGAPAPGVDVASLTVTALAGALIGFSLFSLLARPLLQNPALPAPEARACTTLIDAATCGPPNAAPGIAANATPDDTPGPDATPSDVPGAEPGTNAPATLDATPGAAPPRLRGFLGLGALLGAVAPLLARAGVATEHITLWQLEQAGRRFTVEVPFLPIYMGIGGLLSLSTALLVFAGSLARLAGDLLVTGAGADPALAALWPESTMRWAGGGAMTVAVIWSLVRLMPGVWRAGPAGGEAGQRPRAHADALLVLERRDRLGLVLALVAGVALLVGWLLAREGVSGWSLSMAGVIVLLGAVMVMLGALLSLQIGSSASPVSGTVFVTTLVLALVTLAWGRGGGVGAVETLTGLMVAACVAVCAANDSSQDYKTMLWTGVRWRLGLWGQLLGLVAGALVVPWMVALAHASHGLGSAALPAPQATMFATLVDGLLVQSSVPWRPIAAGAAVGVALVALEQLAGRRGLQLPAMAFAVGLYLPAYLGVGMVLGAAARWFGERGRPQRRESVLYAAGLITGSAAFDLLLGVALVAGFNVAALTIVTLPPALMAATSAAGVLALMALMVRNSR